MEQNSAAQYRLIQYLDIDNQKESYFAGSKGKIVLEGTTTNGFIEKVIEDIKVEGHFEIHYREGDSWSVIKINDSTQSKERQAYNEKAASIINKTIALSKEMTELQGSFY